MMLLTQFRCIRTVVILAALCSVTAFGQTAFANNVELTGDIHVINYDSPYNNLKDLRIGTGQIDPPIGALSVTGGAFLSDYYSISVGGYFPLDENDFPIPRLPYEGVMIVKNSSTVVLGGSISVGTFADSRGELTVSHRSVLRAEGGLVPIEWIGFPPSFPMIIGLEDDSRGEVTISHKSELNVAELLVGNSGRGQLDVNHKSSVTARPFMIIASNPGSMGFVDIRNKSSLMIVGNEPGIEGAFLNVGRSGPGELRLLNSELIIDGEDRTIAPEGGFQLGRNPTGHGTLTLIGSVATVRNMTEPFVAVGRSGFGSLVLKRKSKLVIEDQDGTFLVASSRRGVTGSAEVSISAKSLLDAGRALFLCLEFDGTTPAGTAKINVNGIIRADEIKVGPGCSIDGTGILEGTVTNLGGSIGPDISIEP